MSKIRTYKVADNIWDIKYFLSSYWLGFPKEAWLYAQKVFQKRQIPETKFVIFSTGRTGSTLLTSLLNSNPDIFCDGEILKHRYVAPMRVLRTHAHTSNKKIYGFKLLTHHIKDVQWTGQKDGAAFLQKVINEGYRIIYLERKHRLNQALSMMYAILRNDWHKKKGQKAAQKEMTVDLGALDWWLHGFDELNAYEKKVLHGLPHVHIVYERDLADPEQHASTMHSLCDFVQIPYTEPRTSLRKITPRRYEDFILNADEMIAHLKKGKYAHYVQQPSAVFTHEK